MTSGTLGLYGKLPALGDFVSRRLEHAVTEKWDAWLQSGLAFSRDGLGERWRELYMVAPAWRFCLQSGVLGDDAWCGVMFPSVDRVGRYFPLTVMASIAADTDVVRLCTEYHPWFDQLESIALQSLDPALQFDAWDRALEAWLLPTPLPVVDVEDVTVPIKSADLEGGILHLKMPNRPGTTEYLGQYLFSPGAPRSMWWRTEGGGKVLSVQVVSGLPEPRNFPAMLDEQWSAWGWEEKVVAWGEA